MRQEIIVFLVSKRHEWNHTLGEIDYVGIWYLSGVARDLRLYSKRTERAVIFNSLCNYVKEFNA